MTVTVDQIIDKLRNDWGTKSMPDSLLEYTPITDHYPEIAVTLIIGLWDLLKATAQASVKQIATGTGKVTATVLAGNTIDITIPLSRPIVGAYNVDVLPAVTLTAVVKNRTSTSVTLTVGGLLAIAAGTIVNVIAWT